MCNGARNLYRVFKACIERAHGAREHAERVCVWGRVPNMRCCAQDMVLRHIVCSSARRTCTGKTSAGARRVRLARTELLSALMMSAMAQSTHVRPLCCNGMRKAGAHAACRARMPCFTGALALCEGRGESAALAAGRGCAYATRCPPTGRAPLGSRGLVGELPELVGRRQRGGGARLRVSPSRMSPSGRRRELRRCRSMGGSRQERSVAIFAHGLVSLGDPPYSA